MFWIRTVSTLLLSAAFAWCQNDSLEGRIRRFLPPAQCEQAETALNAHNYTRLQQIVASVRSDGEARAEVLALQGAIAFLAGNMTASAQFFESANALQTLTEADTFTWAMALLKLGNDEAGRQILSNLRQSHPGTSLYIYWLAKIDYKQRRYDDAIAKLQQTIKLDPRSVRAWDSLGLAYDMQGRTEEAETALKKAAALNRALAEPSPWPPHDLGYLLLRIGRPTEAEANLREALRYQPTLVDAHYHLGRTLEKQQRYAQAVEQYRLAVAGDPSATDACYSLAVLYRKLNRDADSVAMFAEYKRRKNIGNHDTPAETEK